MSPVIQNLVIVTKIDTEDNRARYTRPFVPESLLGFSECEYEIKSGEETLSKGSFRKETIDQYQRNLTHDFERLMDNTGNADLQVSFRVNRQSIARAIEQLLGELNRDYHVREKIHGDVKPENCLVALTGAHLIDGLDLSAGQISPAANSLWSAPEQIAVSPTSKATDIYSLGLMLANLVSGQFGGEIVTYLVPFETGNRIVSIVRNPSIFLNSRILGDSSDAEKAWRIFLERCLRFDPQDRYGSAEECKVDLVKLLASFPLSGWVTFELKRGNLQMLRIGDSNLIGRVIQDETYGSGKPIKCARCGTSNRPKAIFCQMCGTSL